MINVTNSNQSKKHHHADSSSKYSLREIFATLPDELNQQIFQHLSMTHLIFSVANVCRLWREISFPIVWERYQYYAKLMGKDDEDLSKFDFSNFFQSRNGRNFIKTMFNEHVYELATRLIKETTLGGIRKETYTPAVIDFSGEKFDWFKTELKMTEDYKSMLDDMIDPNSLRITKKVVSNSNSITSSTEVNDEKNGGGVISSVFNYLSSFFQKNNSSSPKSIEFERKPNSAIVHNGTQSFKVISLGDCSVGKTSLVNCGVKNMNCKKQDFPTIGASFLKQIYKLGPNIQRGLELWDYASPERYSSIAPMYYRGGHLAYLLYDLSDSTRSFGRMEVYAKEVKKIHPMETVVIGNKTDLVPEKDRKERKRAQVLAFDELEGSLYVEMNNVDIKYAHILFAYSAIILHLNYMNRN